MGHTRAERPNYYNFKHQPHRGMAHIFARERDQTVVPLS